MNPYLPEIEEFERQDRMVLPPAGAVLFLGSSTIRQWHTLAQDFPSVAVINRGFGGSQIQDSIFFADRIVIPHRPRLIVFYAGDNDLASGMTPAQVFADFKRLIERVRQDLPETVVVFVSIKPSPARLHLLDGIRAANLSIRNWIRQDRRLGYADVFEPMLAPDGSVRGELFVEDGLHLNQQGYAVWKRAVAPFL